MLTRRCVVRGFHFTLFRALIGRGRGSAFVVFVRMYQRYFLSEPLSHIWGGSKTEVAESNNFFDLGD